VNARCGLETTKGLGPCKGAEAFVVQKEPFPGMGREPISHILLQGRQTLEGVASLVFLSVRKDETRDKILHYGRGGLVPGCRSPAPVWKELMRTSVPRLIGLVVDRADGGEIRCLYAREL